MNKIIFQRCIETLQNLRDGLPLSEDEKYLLYTNCPGELLQADKNVIDKLSDNQNHLDTYLENLESINDIIRCLNNQSCSYDEDLSDLFEDEEDFQLYKDFCGELEIVEEDEEKCPCALIRCKSF